MTRSVSDIRQWFHDHFAEIKEDYFQFLRFKSIAADPSFKDQTLACADWLEQYITKKIGLKARKIETENYPIVYAEENCGNPKASTLLVYGHYDVQPVDPLALWKSDPFEPTEREGLVYARGAVDDKGQVFYALLAMRYWKEMGDPLPVNIKFCIEGEEESSSIGFARALPKIKDQLSADYLLIPDFGQMDKETPALNFGARGLIALEVTLVGSHSDLHSGAHGGIAYNPNRALAELLAKLWDDKGRVQVKGFYDDVDEATEEEVKQFSFRFEKSRYSKEHGIEAFGGEKDRSMGEANCFRPTLEINGMSGGYTGDGIKTVIPREAKAKLTCRLVPRQDPQKIGEQVAQFLKENVVPGMKIHITVFQGSRAFRGNLGSKLAKAASQAVHDATGRRCENILSGGSIPIVADLLNAIQADVVGIGYGLAEDNIHAPNESFDFQRMEKGFVTVVRIFDLMGPL